MDKVQSDFYCGDCDKDMEDVWAFVGGGIAVWTCPQCGYEHEGATQLG